MTKTTLSMVVFLFSVYSTGNQIPLHIVEYNIDKNGRGRAVEQGIDAQIDFVRSRIHSIDILGLIEVEQDCASSEMINGTKMFAEKLGLHHYRYSVEFIESHGEDGHDCTVGNSILSRYPLDYFQPIDFKHQCCKYSHRIGDRIMSIGHISKSHLGTQKGLYLILTHLEAGGSSRTEIIEGINTRFEQINEIENYIKSHINPKEDDVVILGDLNVPNLKIPFLSSFSSTLDHLNALNGLKKMGFQDVFENISNLERTTSTDSTIGDYLGYAGVGFQLDYIFVEKDFVKTQNSFIFNEPIAAILSDHYPIAATLLLGASHQ